jgi:hypothetical protein
LAFPAQPFRNISQKCERRAWLRSGATVRHFGIASLMAEWKSFFRPSTGSFAGVESGRSGKTLQPSLMLLGEVDCYGGSRSAADTVLRYCRTDRIHECGNNIMVGAWNIRMMACALLIVDLAQRETGGEVLSYKNC